MTTSKTATARPSSEEQRYHRRVFAWAMYDWADHGFITTTIVTFFPPYFIAIAAPAFLAAGKSANDAAAMGLAADTASNVFSLVIALALFISAIVSPIIGTYADLTGRRKRILIVVTAFGSILASMMATLTTGLWLLGLALYIGTQIAVNIALGMNSSLLAHVSRPHDMNRVSSLAYALGYIGGGLLLAGNTALFVFADKLGLDSGTAVRIAFFTTGVWWLLFSLPLAIIVPEPPAMPLTNIISGNRLQGALSQLRHTLRDIQRYRELFKMLISFWLYSEGISAIILLATAYGATLGLDNTALVGTILLTQFVGLPYVLIFGQIPNPNSKWRSAYVSMLIWTAITLPILGFIANQRGDIDMMGTFALLLGSQLLGVLFSATFGRELFTSVTQRIDTKGAVLLGLAIFMIIPIWGFFLKTAAEFFMIGWLAGTVQGGVQALSRTIYATMSPKAKSGEFFGIYGLSEKFAGILAPLLYGVVGLITHSPQASIFSIVIFFAVGLLALRRVNVQEGSRLAMAEDEALATLSASSNA
ncbi:MAG: MFS transporter [Anaerolineae bacterium]|nr:MFS transporter [Anaerolineae bacterium]